MKTLLFDACRWGHKSDCNVLYKMLAVQSWTAGVLKSPLCSLFVFFIYSVQHFKEKRKNGIFMGVFYCLPFLNKPFKRITCLFCYLCKLLLCIAWVDFFFNIFCSRCCSDDCLTIAIMILKLIVCVGVSHLIWFWI